ncbi:MAG: response regulator [Bdellovibrionaceae bacterium]|nr:response regulator [Pseudobdellovibrionaceae bacterium]
MSHFLRKGWCLLESTGDFPFSATDKVPSGTTYARENFFELAESIPSFVWTTDAQGNIEYFNREYQSYLGMAVSQDSLLFWSQAVHENDRAESYSRWTKCLSTGDAFEKEHRLLSSDGTYNWFLSRAIPIRNSENQVYRWIGTATNIEKQKSILFSLQSSKHRLEIILEGITDGVTAFDRDGNFVYANPAGAHMCGFKSVAEMLSTPTDQVMDRYLILDEQGQAFANEKLPGRLALKGVKNPPETVVQIEMKDTGKRNWVLISAAPVFDETGEVLYAVSIFRDFTIHKENENSLKSRESAFRLIAETGIILNSSLDYLATLQKLCELIVPLLADWCTIDVISDPKDPKTINWHWNPAKRKWAEEYQRKYRTDWRSSPGTARVFSTGKSELYETISKELLEASIANPDQLKEIRKIGMSSIMCVPIVANNKVLGAITFVASESKRKFSSFDLTLAEDVGRRAGLAIDQSLLYESERHAREQAENANNSKSTFLANMSHEIRTPLNALIGFNELLRSDALSKDERAEYHNIIQRNGELLLHLIDDILDLSKVEAGHLAVETVTVSLSDLLEEINSFKTARASAKGLKFVMDVAPDVPHEFVTDPLRLKQILNNIIGNAIKFTSNGFVRVTVSCDRIRRKLIFKVIDSGIGILPKDREKLFQPFSQADASVTRKYGGTGLGLILSKRLAQRLGGDLVLEDAKDNKGATFRIEIASDLIANSVVEKINILPEKSVKGLKILVVDDSIDNQVLIEHILKSRGAAIETADNGQIGVNKALEKEYDVVLMDVQMPVLDGHSATRILREKGYSRPIIGLTAHAMQDDRRRCLEAGCSDYLTKPIRTDMLIQTISRHIT